MRTLCHDIGARLGCGGCMTALRREGAGPFSVGQAHTMDEVLAAAQAGGVEELLLPVDTLFPSAPVLKLDAAQERRCRTGAAIAVSVPPGQYRAYSGKGEFLALVGADGEQVTVIKSFFEV